MTPQEPSDKILEQAALYALGALEGQEKDECEKSLSEESVMRQAVKDFQEVAGLLGTSVTPVAPPSVLRATLLKRIAAEQKDVQSATSAVSAEQSENSGLTFVRSTDDLWQDVAPGVRVKPLSFNKAQGRMTALARMAPHSNYAAHRHTEPEEFYVLEGSCFCGGQLLHVGDYHRAEAGTIHYETSSQDGCLMLIIFSPNNEILQAVSS